jgi:hypothetical protein
MGDRIPIGLCGRCIASLPDSVCLVLIEEVIPVARFELCGRDVETQRRPRRRPEAEIRNSRPGINLVRQAQKFLKLNEDG